MFVYSVAVKDELNEFNRVDLKERRQGSAEGGLHGCLGKVLPVLTNNSSFERLHVNCLYPLYSGMTPALL